jgi:dTDP-4-amino-4,6-dideoxygalactose transaminase
MGWTIPFNKPYVVGTETSYIAEAVARRATATDGDFTASCRLFLEERFGIGRVFMTTSCTAALEVAALLCDLREGDEVIMPSFTFVSTASAFARAGARLVFVDVREDTLNVDEERVADAITDQTRAIVPVHYAGVGCEMDLLLGLARRSGATLVEDAAQGVNASHRSRALGSIGDLGAYSFHDTKNYHCGQGGALCINSPELEERAEILLDRGTDRGRFLRGEVDQYTWVDLGSSFAQSEILCAFLLAQLEKLDEIDAMRAQISGWYAERLALLDQKGLLRLPVVPEGARTNHHVFHVMLPKAETRESLLAFLAERGIQAVRHYVPLHESEAGRRFARWGELPVSEDVSRRLLRLPLFNELTEGEVDEVTRAIAEHLETRPG